MRSDTLKGFERLPLAGFIRAPAWVSGMSPMTMVAGVVAVLVALFGLGWRFSRAPGRFGKALDAYRSPGMPRFMGSLYTMATPAGLGMALLTFGVSVGGLGREHPGPETPLGVEGEGGGRARGISRRRS
jgi:hypothetical protein